MRILRILVAPKRDVGAKARTRPSFLLLRLPRLVVAGVCSVFALAVHAACPPSAIASLGKPGAAVGQWNAVDRGLLWRAERDGRTSWLYGTIHVGRAEWVRPGPTVQNALEQSDALALELDVRDQAAMRPLTQPADPAVVARLLSGERARRLARQNEAACVEPGKANGLQPILQVMALAGLVARADGLYPEFGADESMAVAARNSGKPVFALETAAAQLQMLTGGSEAEEAEQIDATLSELESGQLRTQMKELAHIWARGDVDKLARYPEWCNCLQTPAEQRLMKRLLDDRNPGLADGIERMHAGGKRVFAAVGALHMVGPQGLPAILAARGFKVAAVPLVAQPAAALPAAPPPAAASRAAPAGRSAKGGRAAPSTARNARGAKASTTARPSGAKAAAKTGSRPAASAKPAARTTASKSKQRR
ncbi:TraB/GumN family protein [Variovorax sp. TBS-050B]|uniref:TraB/GumN family protein n=1 Tax=Variovorax sp. TBS-050B TaxID=2940551 RepID=UPI002476266D|nr:TraB/GumN family protein [Variovorax sp. TBS-050B]